MKKVGSKVERKPLKSIKVGERTKFHNFKYGKDVEGIVTKDLNGYYFVFERWIFEESEENVNHELSKQNVEIHLTSEDKVDAEDLHNINDIMTQEALGFVSWSK